MSTTRSHLHIQHDLLHNFLYVKVPGGKAELRYERHGDDYLDFISTHVPPESRNFGIAGQLMETGLAYAEGQQLKVKPSCEFAQAYLKEHPEYHHLIC